MPDAAPSTLSRFWHRLRPPYRHGAAFERVLGTTLELQIVAAKQAGAVQAQNTLLAEIDRLEGVFSRYLPGSELNRWLRSSGPVPVSPELGQVLRQAQAWQAFSGRAFHPATEALSALWKEAEASGVTPDVRAVLDEMAGPLYTVQEQAGHWTAERLTRLPLGFNSFAKGFIADRACAAAYAVSGVRQVLVNIGGDLRTLGPQGVQVDVADPFTLADNAAPIASVRIAGQGVATSGQARRGFRVGGRWYSHLLDPRSGQPAGQVISASVIAPDSATADVLATVFSVLSPQDSLQLSVNRPGVACLLVTGGGQVHVNSRWKEYQISPPPTRLFAPPEVHHDQADH